ncbi:MAG: hypothetical protein IKS11_01155, partial [Lachnospiraceae bacterium]|nr:hypothetical protein [Lachnospiraceae bacterium]
MRAENDVFVLVECKCVNVTVTDDLCLIHGLCVFALLVICVCDTYVSQVVVFVYCEHLSPE